MANSSRTSAPTIGRVALNVPIPGLFDYLLPASAGSKDIGRRVIVPFGRKRMVGALMEVALQSDIAATRLKLIEEIDRGMPALPDDILQLCRFCAAYYHHPIGPILQLALPTALRRVEVIRPSNDTYYQLTELGKRTLSDSLLPRAHLQRSLFERLRDQGWVSRSALQDLSSNVGPLLMRWEESGWLEKQERLAMGAAGTPPTIVPELNAEQIEAAANLAQPGYRTNLLYGITGSGKTEVYLRLIKLVLARGQQVLVLAPEINLTPQLTARFISRFPGIPISHLHSGLAEGERFAHWLAATRGESRIVLGTRLAVFTPMPELGLIIVDEEHDASFSQQDGLRYSARDLAVYRAQLRNLPAVLGSATPSLETWHNVRQRRYGLYRLSKRAVLGASLPKIELVDTRVQKPQDGLAPRTREALQTTLQQGGQALVFINRRGYAPALVCPTCSWAAPCHRCSARLVLHLRAGRLKCHHCGHEEDLPTSCPSCGNMELKPSGHGTQRLEAALAESFPEARILRVDRDATRRKGSWETMQQQIHAGEANLLVGTQLLAKGHDFPGLNLVAVVNADAALFAQDFRASERQFSQLLQVSGRAGRAGDSGLVLIQTGFPEHPLYQHLLNHDFEGYAEILLREREQTSFPPFSHQVVLRAEAAQLSLAMKFLAQARGLAGTVKNVELYEPVEAVMAKKAGMERAVLLAQSSSRNSLQKMLGTWSPQLYALKPGPVRWHLDVDPLEI
jgi:primosomal protein N' (replication factor Y) (superfamily II helicase)